MRPLVAINFKVYPNSIGKNALKLAKICDNFSKQYKIKTIICVNAIDLKEIAKKVKIDVFSQHMDSNELGKFTGSLPAELIKLAGAKGVLLNHSEKRLSFDVLKKSLIKAKKLRLRTIVCAKNDNEALRIAKLKPDYVAVEPPELIGGKISVSTARPELIKNSVTKISKYCGVLVGAGVHEKKDLEIAIKFGAKGVLLASAITTAKNPANALKKLINNQS